MAVAEGPICKVWWPRHLGAVGQLLATEKLLHGWSFAVPGSAGLRDACNVVVVGLLEMGMEHVQRAEDLKSKMSVAPPLSSLLQSCGGPPGIVGHVGLMKSSVKDVLHPMLTASPCWLFLKQISVCSPSFWPRPQETYPVIERVWLHRQVESAKMQVIYYDQPRYGGSHYSLDKWSQPPAPWHKDDRSEPKEKTKPPKPPWLKRLSSKTTPCELVLAQLNAAGLMQQLLSRPSQPCRQRWCYQLIRTLGGVIATLLTVAIRIPAGICLALLASTPPSSFLATLRRRCLQFCSGPACSAPLRLARSVWHKNSPQILLSSSPLPAPLSSLQNLGPLGVVSTEHSLALLAHSTWVGVGLDIALGAWASSWLLGNGDWVKKGVADLGGVLSEGVMKRGCNWLMGVPAGLKLNHEVAQGFGKLGIKVTEIFGSSIASLCPWLLPVLLGALEVSGLLGLSVLLALCSDALAIFTLHIQILYSLCALVYKHQLLALSALWRLFSGRVDSFDCSVERLVVASLLFTPFLLLLPTTAVFYTFFAALHCSVAALCLLLDLATAALQAFPVHAFCLWLWSPHRFPSGLAFSVYKGGALTGSAIPSLLMTVTPATAGTVIGPFLDFLSSPFTLANAAKTAHNLVSGVRIPYKASLQSLPALPDPPPGIREFWMTCYRAFTFLAS